MAFYKTTNRYVFKDKLRGNLDLKKVLVLTVSLIMLAAGSAHAFTYSSDFESGIDSNWSPNDLPNESNPNFSGFLGRMGSDTASLNLSGLGTGTHEVTLTFDFYAIDSWDGENWLWGWDYFGISGDYEQAWTVDSLDFDNPFSFPYTASESGHLGFNSKWEDDIYRGISITFTHTGDSLNLDFFGRGLQSIDDESWGLDNVTVSTSNASAVPEPGTILLFGSGLFGLGATKRRKKEEL